MPKVVVESVPKHYSATTTECYNVRLHVVNDSNQCPPLQQLESIFKISASFVELNALAIPTLTGLIEPLQLACSKPNYYKQSKNLFTAANIAH